jgi:hypothetical protein
MCINITFRPLKYEDMTLLYKWLNTDTVSEWYGKKAITLNEVESKYAKYISGEKPTQAYIIQIYNSDIADNRDIGYIQTYLFRVIALSQAATQDPAQAQLLERMRTNVETIRSATVIITTVPIVFIYALFQKHFIKGVMIGALKG